MKQILQNLKTGEIELVEVPVPLVTKGHLLIKTSKSVISLGTERMLLEFGKAGWIEKARQQPDKVRQVLRKLKTDGLIPTINAVLSKLDQPLPMGYSQVGTVIEVGSGVTRFKVGDRVVSNGNHAEVVCIPENLCAKVPDEVDDSAAAFTVIASIALQGIRLANPTLGEAFGVIGLGLIGQLTCQILRANGCKVIGFDFDASKVALARSFGADAYVVSDDADPVEIAAQFSGGAGLDGVIITASTRSNDPIHQAPQMCRKRGRVILVGVVGLELSRDDFYKKEISFTVSCSYGPGRYDPNYEKKGLDYPIGFVRWTEQRNFCAILELMREGKLHTSPLIAKKFKFSEALNAYQTVLSDAGALGLLLEYDGDVDLQKRSVHISQADSLKPCEVVTGFIGAGNYASGVLIPAFAKAGAKLYAIASSTGVSGTHIGRKNGFAISTTDYRIILEDRNITSVVITTRHDSHAKLVIESLKAGKHVFVEKPLCITRDELREISQTISELNSRPILMVGYNRRFSPLVQKMKNLLSSVSGSMSFIMTVNAGKIPVDHWTQDLESGGGRIVGEACHFIDLLRYLSGSPIKEYKTFLLSGVETYDTITIQLTFSNGSIGTIHYFSNGSKDFPKERLEVFTAGKILQLENFISLIGYGWSSFSSERLWSQDKGQNACALAFVDAVREGKCAPIPLEEILEVAEVTLNIAGL